MLLYLEYWLQNIYWRNWCWHLRRLSWYMKLATSRRRRRPPPSEFKAKLYLFLKICSSSTLQHLFVTSCHLEHLWLTVKSRIKKTLYSFIYQNVKFGFPRSPGNLTHLYVFVGKLIAYWNQEARTNFNWNWNKHLSMKLLKNGIHCVCKWQLREDGKCWNIVRRLDDLVSNVRHPKLPILPDKLRL